MERQEILEKLNSGEIKLHQIENFTDSDTAIAIRNEYIEYRTGSSLKTLQKYNYNSSQTLNRNIENSIGGVSIPVGIAGPLKFSTNEEFFVPIATTEGALTASINRGLKLISLSGGAKVIQKYHGITRAPVFETKGIEDSESLIRFINENIDKFKEFARSTSEYCDLLDYKPFMNGNSLFVRFRFDTNDAMGMNMAVQSTKLITDFIEENYDTKLIAMSGNVCIDKKSNLINEFEGRGREIHAEVVIPRDIVQKNLNTTPEEIFKVGYKKLWQGSRVAGSFGVNAHAANILAGIFIATGQDPAHVVDASNVVTTFDIVDGDLYVSVKISGLNIATVGGGTHLTAQNEILDMMLTDLNTKNIVENKTEVLAKIIGATVLAGELSLNASFAGRNFVKAHEALGRGKK